MKKRERNRTWQRKKRETPHVIRTVVKTTFKHIGTKENEMKKMPKTKSDGCRACKVKTLWGELN